MIFEPTSLVDVYHIQPECVSDERGFFARTWNKEDAERLNLNTKIEQCGISFNRHQGTLRGLHYQAEPFAEAKLVRCSAGAIFDVVVDLRENSETYGKWISFELTAENRNMLYIPEGCAHGFQTLVDNTEIFYQISMSYHPEAACGIIWNDPTLNITWPMDVSLISERDAGLPQISVLKN